MKKTVIILLVLCLAATAVIGGVSVRSGEFFVPQPTSAVSDEAPSAVGAADSPADFVITDGEYHSPASEAESEPQPEPQGETEPATSVGRLDYEALYALHDKDDMVMRIGGQEERWGDYFYVLYSQCSQIENYFNSMAAYYGMLFNWNDPIEEDSEETFAETATETAASLMTQLAGLELFAEEHDITLGEDSQAAIEELKKADIVGALGEDGTEEAFREALRKVYLSDEMYDRIIRQNVLYQEVFNQLYGEKAEKLSDEEALQYLEENGYVSAAHILFKNTDPETGEPLDEEALAAKKAELEAILAELNAIEDDQERAAAFLEKIPEISEDSGSAHYPEGYTFTEGRMVPEFENAAKELEEYAVSEIVETTYGYHILLRLPLKADAIVEYSSTTGDARTARMLAANELYGKQLQDFADSLELTWLPGCEEPTLLDYITEKEA